MCCECNVSKSGLKDDFVVYGTKFTTPTEYENQFLIGRYRIYFQGMKFLIYGVDWEYFDNEKKAGGFRIKIPGFAVTNDTVFFCQFY